jgi:hypothetical protein
MDFLVVVTASTVIISNSKAVGRYRFSLVAVVVVVGCHSVHALCVVLILFSDTVCSWACLSTDVDVSTPRGVVVATKHCIPA